jgi:hypothetical protein
MESYILHRFTPRVTYPASLGSLAVDQPSRPYAELTRKLRNGSGRNFGGRSGDDDYASAASPTGYTLTVLGIAASRDGAQMATTVNDDNLGPSEVPR